jgi:hypothetical protein
MRAFVRLLPRLLLLGVAAAALLVLAERERSAHADTLRPLPTPAPPAAAPAALAPRPVLPAPALPSAPVPTTLTGAAGPLSGVPEVAPPEPLLPDLPPVPEVPDVPTTLDRVLELGAAPAPAAPAAVNAPDRAPSTLAEPASARLDPPPVGGIVDGLGVGVEPARSPPADAPGSPHPCPGGGSPHPTPTDAAAFPDPTTDDASRRVGLLAEARADASTLLGDPLLRPD